jgi:hypothetical protein
MQKLELKKILTNINIFILDYKIKALQRLLKHSENGRFPSFVPPVSSSMQLCKTGHLFIDDTGNYSVNNIGKC